MLGAEDADSISTEAFAEYASRVYQYLQVGAAPQQDTGWRQPGAPAAACIVPRRVGLPVFQRAAAYCCRAPMRLPLAFAAPFPLLAAQVVENRIFSEGLHVLGQPPPPDQAAQYLAGKRGPAHACDGLVAAPGGCLSPSGRTPGCRRPSPRCLGRAAHLAQPPSPATRPS